MKLTKDQFYVLHALSLLFTGLGRINSPELQQTAIELSRNGLISDIYEHTDGAISCRIADAGRVALQGAEHDQQG